MTEPREIGVSCECGHLHQAHDFAPKARDVCSEHFCGCKKFVATETIWELYRVWRRPFGEGPGQEPA